MEETKLTVYHWLRLRAFEAQRGPEAGAVVEAPALLHFGGAAFRCDVCAWGPPVTYGGLSALNTLAPRASHAHSLLKT